MGEPVSSLLVFSDNTLKRKSEDRRWRLVACFTKNLSKSELDPNWTEAVDYMIKNPGIDMNFLDCRGIRLTLEFQNCKYESGSLPYTVTGVSYSY